MMTLRQVEVIRAVMVTGTIGGAAKLLNVSAPGISRLVKYTERSLGIRFFQRRNGRYFPTPEAENIFEQINGQWFVHNAWAMQPDFLTQFDAAYAGVWLYR